MAKKPAKKTVRKMPKKKAAKKPKLECTECGLVLSVDEMCECPDLNEVLCCGVPMQEKE